MTITRPLEFAVAEELPSTPIIPHSCEAEEAVIGGILIDPDAFDGLATLLTPNDFYIFRHRSIWEAFISLRENHTPIDFLTIAEELDRKGQLGEIGGPAYLTSLLNQVPTSVNIEAYGRIVQATSVRRKILNACNQTAQLAYDQSRTAEDILFQVAEKFGSLAATSNIGWEVEGLGDVVSREYDNIEARARDPKEVWGMATGLPKLDRETGGLQEGELTYLAGEPGAGKSWLALTIADHLADNNIPGAFISLEMKKSKIVHRLLAGRSGVRTRAMRSGFLGEDDWPKITIAVEKLGDLPLYLDDRSTNCAGLRAILFRLKREKKIRWFVLDYLLKLVDSGKDDTERTANISDALGKICHDLDLAGVVLHSITKAGMDTRGDPIKAWLRGSGQLLHDADNIFVLTAYAPGSGTMITETDKKTRATLWMKKGRELEDSMFNIHLVRKSPSPFFGELDERRY